MSAAEVLLLPPLPRLPLPGRRRLAAARARAVVADALLLGYGAWCLSFLAGTVAGEIGRLGWLESRGGFLGHRPWLLLLAPLAAAALAAAGPSIGERLNRVVHLGPDGREAGRDRRAFRALLATFQAAVVLLPAALGVLRAQAGGGAGLHLFLSALLALAFLALGWTDPAGRSLVDRLAGTRTALAPERETGPRRPWWRRANPWIVVLLLVLTFAVAVVLTGLRPWELVENIQRTANLWSRLTDPDWTILGRVVERIVETVFLALFASALALPFAFVLAFLGARNVTARSLPGRAAFVATRVFMNVVRSIEPLVWVIIFSLWVGVGPDAGALALFVHSVAALGKLFSEAVEAIDPGPVEAITATGAAPLQVLRYGVVPQVVPPFLSFTVYRWDINVRMATILGMAGGGGIGDLLITYQQLGAWSKVGTILLFVTLVVWALDWASSKARQRLV